MMRVERGACSPQEAERALAELAADAKTITSRSVEVYGSGNQGNSALSRLNAEMRQAAAVLRDCESERKKLGAVASAAGEPLFTLHADTPGELAYALAYVNAQEAAIVAIDLPEVAADIALETGAQQP